MARKNKQFSGIDQALNDGLVLRAFRSGSGLRFVRIEVPNKPESKENLKACGAHPNLREALMFASIDYKAGGNTYESHYLTGTTKTEDNLDEWIFRGHNMKAQKANGQVKLEALDWSDKRVIVSTEAPDFRTAYSTLCDKISNEHFKEAYKF